MAGAVFAPGVSPMPAYHVRATLLPDGDTPLDLWVRDGHFTFAPVDGAEELAAGAMFALPGLVDAHAHVGMAMAEGGSPYEGANAIEQNLNANLAAGVTALRDPGSADGGPIAYQEREGFPRLQASHRFLAPEGRGQPIAEWTAPDALGTAAAQHATTGARWVKIVADWARWDKALGQRVVPANYDEASIRAAVEAAHAAGVRVVAHAQGDAAPACIAAGVDTLEHGDALTPALLAEMARKGIAWTPTLAMTERLAAIIGRDETQRRAFANERYDIYRALLPEAARLGVTVLAGTDMLPHGNVALEVESLFRHGLSPRDALAAGSTSARTFLGYDNIVEGAHADLVLYAGDPRNDPKVLRKPSLVMLGGVIHSRP
jgi:imidazolonepropionase-like amidohydrolase